MLKRREKEIKREQKQKEQKKQEIKTACELMPKEKKDKVEMKRWESVRRTKEAELMNELKRMN